MPDTTLAPHDIDSLERATLDAVCPATQSELPGWLLPFDPADIGRARSAIPLRHQDLDIAALPAIEQLYRDNGLPPTLRIAHTPGLRHWQARLLALGYRQTAPVHVQIATVADMQTAAHRFLETERNGFLHTAMQATEFATPAQTCAPAQDGASIWEDGHTMPQAQNPVPAQDDANRRAEVVLLNSPAHAWASVYTAPGFDAEDGALRVQLLSRSRFALYAYVQSAGVSLAAGTACISRDWLSVHGMRTLPHAQGQGLGASLLAAFTDLARQRGITRAFLQVEADNAPALALYRRFGFTTAWTYHYWKAPG
jgi:ribosomal protein S18 acetylase RimI-like enzyme